MVGRGTRIDEPTHKYKFWLYDHTGVTALFGTDFLTAAPVTRQRPPGEGEGDEGGGGDDGGGDDEDDVPPLPELVGGQPVLILPQGRFILQRVQGSFPLMTPPLREQQQIAENLRVALGATEELLVSVKAQLAEIERLPARLLAQAFGDASP